MLKYIYDTGRIERDFVLKKVEHDCNQDPERTKLIGVMCRSCPFFEGMKDFYSETRWLRDFILGHKIGTYVFCKFHKEDDEGASEILSNMYRKFEEEAITHIYD